jgi:hypothetical protein
MRGAEAGNSWVVDSEENLGEIEMLYCSYWKRRKKVNTTYLSRE